jgi:hypothetical protein
MKIEKNRYADVILKSKTPPLREKWGLIFSS